MDDARSDGRFTVGSGGNADTQALAAHRGVRRLAIAIKISLAKW